MDLYLSFIAFILGLIIGSFLNFLIWRLYKDESLAGRSHCPKCGHKIFWYDNIPLLSFILLGGRCRYCQNKISWQYPLVELVSAILFLAVWRLHQPAIDILGAGLNLSAISQLLKDFLLVSVWLAVFVYDWRWQLVPMALIWPTIIAVAGLQFLSGISLTALLIGGALGAGFFLIQYILTAKQGIGEGDIWLGLLLGFAFPRADKLFLIMIVSYGLGALVGLSLLLVKRKKWRSAIALGPFLAIGSLVAILWGEAIINWYFGLIF